MTPEERAAGLSTVDLGEGFKFTPEDLDDDDDRDELISSDIAAGGLNLLYAVLIVAGFVGVVALLR